MIRKRFLSTVLAILFSFAGHLSAATVVESFGGVLPGTGSPVGQSFQTPSGAGSFTMTGFEFLTGTGAVDTTPGATSVYIFNQEYAGLIANIPTLTVGGSEGLIGVGTVDGSGTFQVSGSTVTLQPATDYYAYTAVIATIEGIQPVSSGDRYTDGKLYLPTEVGGFEALPADLSFRVLGDAVPEPSGWLLLIVGAMLVFARRMR